MTSKINPLTTLRTPKKFVADAETRAYFKELNFIIFQMRERLGNDATDIGSNKSRTNKRHKRKA